MARRYSGGNTGGSGGVQYGHTDRTYVELTRDDLLPFVNEGVEFDLDPSQDSWPVLYASEGAESLLNMIVQCKERSLYDTAMKNGTNMTNADRPKCDKPELVDADTPAYNTTQPCPPGGSTRSPRGVCKCQNGDEARSLNPPWQCPTPVTTNPGPPDEDDQDDEGGDEPDDDEDEVTYIFCETLDAYIPETETCPEAPEDDCDVDPFAAGGDD